MILFSTRLILMFKETRLSPYLEFILSTEKLKTVERRTSVIGTSRRENSAEHSWQVALLAYVLRDFANESVDIDKVVRMLLVHDLPEVLSGDTFFYSSERDGEAKEDLFKREHEAAKELFSSLPEKTASELMSLWEEYEKRETPESRFAHALDRVIPGLQNYFSNGGTWKEFFVSYEVAKVKNQHVKDGSLEISEFIYSVLESSSKKGLFED
jgi:putative hydrolase of HD superfamily